MRQMPLRVASRERGKARHHKQEDAPEQVMNVQPGCGDQVAEPPVRKQLEMDDRDDPEDDEGDEEGGERP
jgi:hypothetical protein